MAGRGRMWVLAFVALALGSSVAVAQPRGGGAPGGGRGVGPGAIPGGGGWHGAPAGGGTWHGGDWHGGDWHGGNWHGGNWHGNDWHGGNWHGGWYGGWYGPSVGVYLGSPYWGWPYYYYPYGYGWPWGYGYTYPSPYVYAPREPSAYIEQAPQTPAVHAWYYCTDPAGYYPYVQRCAKPWVTVAPQDVPAGSAAPAPEPSGGTGGSR